MEITASVPNFDTGRRGGALGRGGEIATPTLYFGDEEQSWRSYPQRYRVHGGLAPLYQIIITIIIIVSTRGVISSSRRRTSECRRDVLGCPTYEYNFKHNNIPLRVLLRALNASKRRAHIGGHMI